MSDDPTQQLASRYVSVLLWPVIAAGIFLIAGIQQTNAMQIVLFTNTVLLIAVCWKAHHEKANWQTASIVGALCGGVAAIFPAAYILVTDFHVVRIFNLITQPAITGVLMAIATGFTYSVLQLTIPKRIPVKDANKGGDIT